MANPRQLPLFDDDGGPGASLITCAAPADADADVPAERPEAVALAARLPALFALAERLAPPDERSADGEDGLPALRARLGRDRAMSTLDAQASHDG